MLVLPLDKRNRFAGVLMLTANRPLTLDHIR
jgi:hypothetical protein